jgi:mannose-6-phosphate isomerase-like protein (cupin superfamily)
MRIPSMSSGVYTLHKGENDGQAPHTKDEIYYIIKGKAKIMVGKENYEVKEGSIVFVEAYKEHRFFRHNRRFGRSRGLFCRTTGS